MIGGADRPGGLYWSHDDISSKSNLIKIYLRNRSTVQNVSRRTIIYNEVYLKVKNKFEFIYKTFLFSKLVNANLIVSLGW